MAKERPRQSLRLPLIGSPEAAPRSPMIKNLAQWQRLQLSSRDYYTGMLVIAEKSAHLFTVLNQN